MVDVRHCTRISQTPCTQCKASTKVGIFYFEWRPTKRNNEINQASFLYCKALRPVTVKYYYLCELSAMCFHFWGFSFTPSTPPWVFPRSWDKGIHYVSHGISLTWRDFKHVTKNPTSLTLLLHYLGVTSDRGERHSQQYRSFFASF